MEYIKDYLEMINIQHLRYELTAAVPIRLHQDIPTITLRGAFGYALAQVIARRTGVRELEEQVRLYKNIFMPCNDGNKSSFHHELPRPFVLRGFFSRPDHRSFILEAMVLSQDKGMEHFFDEVIDTIGWMGIGIEQTVCQVKKVYSSPAVIEDPEPLPFLTVNFLTPCSKIKAEERIFFDEIPFYALFSRLLDRIEEFNTFYGDGIPFASFEERGELKKLAHQIPWKKISGGRYRATRVSGRTSDVIKMDGFIGKMEYFGDFRPFRHYLKYLPFIHVGRFSVFGCGVCELSYSETEC